jgi:hypothetical protein
VKKRGGGRVIIQETYVDTVLAEEPVQLQLPAANLVGVPVSQECTAYPANVVKFTLGRLAVRLIPGYRSTTGTFLWLIQKSRQ